MKSALDPRHQKRRDAVKALFANAFTTQSAPPVVRDVLSHADTIDKKISVAAPTWPVDKLNKIDLAILRYAVYELDFTQTPAKVIVDEAIELAKEYGSESSPSFVNGVLGTILKQGF